LIDNRTSSLDTDASEAELTAGMLTASKAAATIPIIAATDFFILIPLHF
jgi:hypothetical protein